MTLNKKIKLALGIEYDGSLYHGWQKQNTKINSIQQCLENALFIITKELITVHCAGRTDAGVHAIGQVIHFETCIHRSNITWMLSINQNLPNDITVQWVMPVVKNFHARFSAISRRYYYLIYNHLSRSAILNKKLLHVYNKLNINDMIKASKYLLGENNFSTFRSSQCQSKSTYRNIHFIHIRCYGNYIIFDIKANSFLHHMIRNIIGSLLKVGKGYKEPLWIYEILKLCKRDSSIPTVPSYGLYLVEVEYPMYFNIPTLFINNYL